MRFIAQTHTFYDGRTSRTNLLMDETTEAIGPFQSVKPFHSSMLFLDGFARFTHVPSRNKQVLLPAMSY